MTSDRGLCGAYNANIFRRSEELFSLLRSEGKEPVLYVVGRKALGYYSFRNWDVTDSWTGFSERPTYENAQEIATTLVDAFTAGIDDGGMTPAKTTFSASTNCTSSSPSSSRCCRSLRSPGGSLRW